MTTHTNDGSQGTETNNVRARLPMTTTATTVTTETVTRPRSTGRHQLPLLLAAAAIVVAGASSLGCGPTFDPSSLIEKTRVLGARVEVNGAPERATPLPGETATVTWLIAAPDITPPLGWAFALCKPAPGTALGCAGDPLAVFEGTDNPPRFAVPVPVGDAWGGVTRLAIYGRICASSQPLFDPDSGYPGCTGGADGTTTSVAFRVQNGADPNHNPVIDRGLQFDGQPWAAATAGADPCVAGPRVNVSTADHLLTIATAGTDRETYTTLMGDPPVPTTARESLQISQFATAGDLKSPYSFVEAADDGAAPAVTAKWKTPKASEITDETPVTFTFMVRDGRGGTDWTTRTACVVP